VGNGQGTPSQAPGVPAPQEGSRGCCWQSGPHDWMLLTSLCADSYHYLLSKCRKCECVGCLVGWCWVCMGSNCQCAVRASWLQVQAASYTPRLPSRRDKHHARKRLLSYNTNIYTRMHNKPLYLLTYHCIPPFARTDRN
jgi:hypothetical protein